MKIKEFIPLNLWSCIIAVAIFLDPFFASLTSEFAMADDSNRDRPQVIITYAPTDEEVLEELLYLAGEDPNRQQAVRKWKAKKGLDLFTYHEDHIVQIHCEDMVLKADDLRDLALFPEITSLYFENTPLSDDILELITQHKTLEEIFIHDDSSMDNRICDVAANLPNLWRVVIGSSQIDDQGLKHIAEQRSLIVLSLSNGQITSQGLKHLVPCKRLTSLFLANNPIQDIGLIDLAKLTDLESIDLEGTKITDRGLEHLQELQSVARLNVGGTAITDQSAGVLIRFKKLAHLFLNDTQITNKTVEIMPCLPKLGELNLRNTEVDDECIADLEKIGHLRDLDIRGTKISRAGAERLQRSVKQSIQCDYGYLPKN